MKVVHIARDKKDTAAQELARALTAKWDRRDRLKAEKKYGIKLTLNTNRS